jgi:hypothetical protein
MKMPVLRCQPQATSLPVVNPVFPTFKSAFGISGGNYAAAMLICYQSA